MIRNFLLQAKPLNECRMAEGNMIRRRSRHHNSTLQTPHSPLNSPHSTLHSPHSPLHSPHFFQQQRSRYHIPKNISPAPSRNHQTSPGRISARIITSPARTAQQPTFPLFPRKKTASRYIPQYTQKAVRLCSLISHGLCCAHSS